MVIILYLQYKKSENWRIMNILKEALMLLELIPIFNVSYCYREANSIANTLSKIAIDQPEDTMVVSNLSQCQIYNAW